MKDELLSCYQHYAKMVDYQYNFVLGKKKKEYIVGIFIKWENFVHLTGIHHLKDLPELRVNHKIIIRKIAHKEISMATLCKSKFFSTHSLDIEYRIKYLTQLEEFYLSENLVFDYLHRSDSQSFIDCDWMLTGLINNEKCYIFLKTEKGWESSDRGRRKYFMLSFFPERQIIYGKNAVNVSVLLKQRIHLPSGRSDTFSLNKCYDISRLEKW